MRYLAQYEEPEAWYTVGRMLDISVADRGDGARGRGGRSRRPRRARRAASSCRPAASRRRSGEGGTPSVELAEQGFYSVRLQGMGERRPFQVAVNLDPAESDLSALPPAEFVNTATGRRGDAVGGWQPRAARS